MAESKKCTQKKNQVEAISHDKNVQTNIFFFKLWNKYKLELQILSESNMGGGTSTTALFEKDIYTKHNAFYSIAMSRVDDDEEVDFIGFSNSL